jgi:TfoX/Sxy family transcriptional regulator of competence genes
VTGYNIYIEGKLAAVVVDSLSLAKVVQAAIQDYLEEAFNEEPR